VKRGTGLHSCYEGSQPDGSHKIVKRDADGDGKFMNIVLYLMCWLLGLNDKQPDDNVHCSINPAIIFEVQ